MPKVLSRSVTLGVPLLLACGAAHAGSYLRSEGEVQYNTTVSASTAADAWDSEGKRFDPGCDPHKSSWSHYAEWGYSYYYTLFAESDLSRSVCGDREKAGIGDVKLGVRGRTSQFVNNRAWEVDVTVPLRGSQPGQARLGCGALGVSVGVDERLPVGTGFSAGYGAGLKFWEKPLAHQASAGLSASGPLWWERWSWYTGIGATVPISSATANRALQIDDCGTEAKVIRQSAELKFNITGTGSIGCGVSSTLIGEDVTRSRGVHCAYSHVWR